MCWVMVVVCVHVPFKTAVFSLVQGTFLSSKSCVLDMLVRRGAAHRAIYTGTPQDEGEPFL